MVLLDMAEFANSEYTDEVTRHLIDAACVVNLDEEESASYFSLYADLETLFSSEVDMENAYRISWKEIIDPSLLSNDDFRHAMDDSVVREFIRVSRLDTGTDYYIIPFDKYTQGRYLSYAAIIVDSQDGHFMQASCVKEPVRYIQITKEEAIARLIEAHPEYVEEDVTARLVWEPGRVTNSPFYPYWELTVGDKQYCVVKQ